MEVKYIFNKQQVNAILLFKYLKKYKIVTAIINNKYKYYLVLCLGFVRVAIHDTVAPAKLHVVLVART